VKRKALINAALSPLPPSPIHTLALSCLPHLRHTHNPAFFPCSELKRKALINAALSRHGLASASEAKRKRLMIAAETEADEAIALAGKRVKLSDAQVAPDDLTGRVVRVSRLVLVFSVGVWNGEQHACEGSAGGCNRNGTGLQCLHPSQSSTAVAYLTTLLLLLSLAPVLSRPPQAPQGQGGAPGERDGGARGP
jgi:hypothetical protein